MQPSNVNDRKTKPAPDWPKPRLLVVDEDSAELLCYSDFLEHQGYQVLATSSFADGVACKPSHRTINPTATISPCLDWSLAGW